jgi:hypothetical protein
MHTSRLMLCVLLSFTLVSPALFAKGGRGSDSRKNERKMKKSDAKALRNTRKVEPITVAPQPHRDYDLLEIEEEEVVEAPLMLPLLPALLLLMMALPAVPVDTSRTCNPSRI